MDYGKGRKESSGVRTSASERKAKSPACVPFCRACAGILVHTETIGKKPFNQHTPFLCACLVSCAAASFDDIRNAREANSAPSVSGVPVRNVPLQQCTFFPSNESVLMEWNQKEFTTLSVKC